MAHLTCECIKIEQNPQERETKSIIMLFLFQTPLQWFLKAHSNVLGSLWAQKDKCWFPITELVTVTSLLGDQQQPPAPLLYNPNVFLPLIALNLKGRIQTKPKIFLFFGSHNASNPSGSEEIPRWGAQTQHSPSFCSQRMWGDIPWPGSAKRTLPASNLLRSKAPTKAFSSLNTCCGMKCFP